MAQPVDSYIILPDDASNTGKKVRSQTRLVGGQTVHEHLIVPVRQEAILGVYGCSSALTSVSATAHTVNTGGFFWIHVPIAISGKSVRLRRLQIAFGISAATPTMPTTPRIAASRFTFTGTASGAAITPVPNDSTYPTAVCDIRTAITGLTVTTAPASAVRAHALCPAFLLSGTVASIMQFQTFTDELIRGTDEDSFWRFNPGQGLVLWQPDAGTTGDIRRFTMDLGWDEIDTA